MKNVLSAFNIDTLLPARAWAGQVNGATLRADLFAGFTNAAIVLPQGVAFAAIAGLPPEYGLYTAMVPTILSALFGSSMVMVSGPTTAISAVVMSTLSGQYEIGSPEFVSAALLLAMLVGVIQILFAVAQAGKLASFVSNSVMLGFTMAAAVLIFVSQLKDALGVSVERGGSVFERLYRLSEAWQTANFNAMLIAAVTFAVALVLSLYAKRLPGFLIALIVGTLVAAGLGADVRTIGEIDAILPSFNLGTRFVANQEVMGQGIANFFGSFFQAYPSSGSFTRSGVNYAAGAVTPLSAVFSGVFLVIVLLLVSPYIKYVPKTEVLILAVTFLTGVLIELELALLFGVLLSFGSFVYRTAKPTLQIEAPDPMLPGRIFRDAEEFGLPECPQVMITRFDGPMYFGSAEYLEAEFDRLRLERPSQNHIIVNLKGTGDIDLAGVDALISESQVREKAGGGLHVIARSIKLMARLEKLGLIKSIHGSHLFENKHEAIGLLVPRLDLDVCAGCTAAVFHECARNKARAEARHAEEDAVKP